LETHLKKIANVDRHAEAYTDECRKKVEDKIMLAEYKIYKHIKEQVTQITKDMRPTIGQKLGDNRPDPVKSLRDEMNAIMQ
jgi:hypothetical protein